MGNGCFRLPSTKPAFPSGMPSSHGSGIRSGVRSDVVLHEAPSGQRRRNLRQYQRGCCPQASAGIAGVTFGEIRVRHGPGMPARLAALGGWSGTRPGHRGVSAGIPAKSGCAMALACPPGWQHWADGLGPPTRPGHRGVSAGIPEAGEPIAVGSKARPQGWVGVKLRSVGAPHALPCRFFQYFFLLGLRWGPVRWKFRLSRTSLCHGHELGISDYCGVGRSCAGIAIIHPQGNRAGRSAERHVWDDASDTACCGRSVSSRGCCSFAAIAA
jgi:hypothetical protein